MAKRRKSERKTAGPKTLVRAANGDLYVVTKTKIVKLNKRTGSRVRKILEKAADEVSCVIGDDVPTLASGVNLSATEIFGCD